jgi:hypothetical protein
MIIMRIPKLSIIYALLTVTVCAAAPASAQITIKIPKLREIFREKPTAEPTPKAVVTESSAATSEKDVEKRASSQPQVSKVEPVDECDSGAEYVHLRDLAKTKKEVTEYVPGQREYFVSILSDYRNEYLEAAMLPWVRESWLKERGDQFARCLTPALDDLAAVARTKLPTFTGPTRYKLGTAAEKSLIRASVPDTAKAKVFMTGVIQANWLIAKDNYNFPTSRYKHGAVLYKNPGQDFCWVVFINIIQDYAGGGTYGASYGNYVGRSLSGCPAVK